MPTLYSRGVATQASVADLARTTATSSAEIDQAFNEGADTGTLWETAIPCHDSRDDDTGMHFIGDYQSIPFHTVHAGKQFFNIQCEVRRSLRPRRISDAFKRKPSVDSESGEFKKQLTPPQKPHALAITVFLSPRSFESVHPTDSLRDIKIDAYYNGALLSSKIVTRKFAREKYLNKEQIVRISGFSNADKREQALLLVPAGQYPDGTLHVNKRNKETAVQRWNKISLMLDNEALNLPLSSAAIADGLQALAKVNMPSEIGRMHKGGRTYSFIDVVVTSGMLQETVEPTFSGTRDGMNSAASVLFNVSSKFDGYEVPPLYPTTAPAESPPGFLGKRSKGPGLSIRIPASNRRPRYGYVDTIEPPQRTVEQEFQEIQMAAISPTKDTTGEECDFRKERFTRSKTPGLLINDFASSPDKQTTVKKRKGGSVKPAALPEPTRPKSRHRSPARSITSSLSSPPSTPIAIKPQQSLPKRKRDDSDDISVRRQKTFAESGCALTLSNRIRVIGERRDPEKCFHADTVLCINRFVFY